MQDTHSQLNNQATYPVFTGQDDRLIEASIDHKEDTQYDVDIDGYDPSQFERQSCQSTKNISEEWSAPQPITTNLLDVLPMEAEMIPEPLRPWLTDIAYRMKCPLDFVAVAAITMFSSLIGTRLTIQPKNRDDWTIVSNVWGAVIGDPSTMKTPSVNEVFRPLNRISTEAREQFEEEQKRYQQEQMTYELQKKVYQSQELDRLKGKPSTDPIGYPETPKNPTERRFIANDPTIEKLADLLNENPTGILVTRDELIALIAAWDKSGREQDRAFYLEGWNGNGSIIIDRMARGTTHVKNVCITLFGGIQPSRLLGYLKAATEHDNDGFVQRLQLAVFPDKAAWAYTDEFPDKAARDKAFTLIKQIVQSDFAAIAYPANEYNRLPYTRFDEQAQQVFKDWLVKWETQVLPNESGLLQEHFTKYRSLVPSLALIFHVLNCESNPVEASEAPKRLVSIEAARMAIRWCEYLQSHARRIYGLLDTVSATAAKELLRHLKKGDLKDGFKVRDVMKKGWANLNTTASVDSALAELIDRNWLKEVVPTPPMTGRPEAPHYLIHPQIISQDT
ncbi:DUF3987 domain-containing protein [Spirosoma sp. HMF4905]|uniref:DUF3987 domain-containing protein n=1 Tax=Spirosoma arboris TaxID=2682092 RepID=A0A7K1SR90_9BACT|nr:YfjI family protein [Spirosoma arboris]MVM36335.1 DUF3987 domain-containing protein [Spirosoma arboris]